MGRRSACIIGHFGMSSRENEIVRKYRNKGVKLWKFGYGVSLVFYAL